MPRRFILLALVAASLAPPAMATAQSAPPKLTVPYTQFTLPNGLTVILHEDHSVPLVTVNMWYHAGSGREKPGRTGFAHLFEHLMFEGSKHVKEGEFDTLLETAGGDNNGSTRQQVQAVTAQDLARAAAKYIQPDRFAVVVVGDRTAIEQKVRQLNLGPVTLLKVEDVVR